MKFRRNYFFKLIWNFEYKRAQSFGSALLEGGFGDLFMLERPRWSATLLKLHGGFVGVALRHGCSPVDLVVFFGARFNDSTSGGLLLHTEYLLYIYIYIPSTHLTHYICFLKHWHFIYFITFSALDEKTLSLLQVLFSLSIEVEIYLIMYICTRAYAYTVYTHMY